MIIREATATDVPGIVDLLKLSLGESLMPKSEKYWNWKHVQNPFGASPVLVAEENGTLIGVRAFMRWDWTSEGKIFRAIRAVDTATHPGHQGKGIFKKLTLQLVDHCTAQGIDFVFNTPNKQSGPGYIKMGWEEAGKLPLRIRVLRPVNIARNLLLSSKIETPAMGHELGRLLSHPGLPALLDAPRFSHLATACTPAYLQWRYADVPVVKYDAVGVGEGPSLSGVLIYRYKTSRLGVELRVTDCFAKTKNDFRELLKKVKQQDNGQADFMTFSGATGNLFKGIQWNGGPVVTVRKLALRSTEQLKGFKQWSPSIGDLELF